MSKQISDLRMISVLGLGAVLAGCVVQEPPRRVVAPGPPPAAISRVVVYPAHGQSPQQMDRDRYECHVWAVQQTGFDPSQPGVPAGARVAVQPYRPGAGTAVGAIAGAILGAAIAGPEDAGAGLILGGVTGAAIGASNDAATAQAQASAQQRQYNRSYAQAQEGASNYRRAISACLTGRGYTIG